MFGFAQKELAPKAYEIDKKNEFSALRVSKYTPLSVDILLFHKKGIFIGLYFFV